MDIEFKIENAKKIFTHYKCNKFHMIRDGHFEEWKKMNIPEECEIKWTLEFINETIDICNFKMKNYQPWALIHLLPIQNLINKIEDKKIYEDIVKLIIEYTNLYCSISELPHVINFILGNNESLSDGIISIAHKKGFEDISQFFCNLVEKLIDKYKKQVEIYDERFKRIKMNK